MNQIRPSCVAVCIAALASWTAGSLAAQGQTPAPPAPAAAPAPPDFGSASRGLQQQVETSFAELSKLRERIADEMLPLTRQQREVEAQLRQTKSLEQEVSRLNDTRGNELTSLTVQIDQLKNQATYLVNLLGEYGRGVEARVHIAEKQRLAKPLEASRLARENAQLTQVDLCRTELDLVDASIAELEEELGGMRFEGRAIADGIVKQGTFVVLGPTALFRSADGQAIGAVVDRPGSDPVVAAFGMPEDREAAAQLVVGTGGSFPFDPTLGNAQKVETISEPWWEHVKKGGPIMVPIFTLAGLALLVVLLKWMSLSMVARPSKKQVAVLLDFIDGSDYASAVEQADALRGPAGRMLQAGARRLGEPRELVEEVMFEHVMTTRLRLQSWLPFVAICATSAPLLGLLGTVTGIMNTFALMTVVGTGDPKALSSGISEALITTEYGLIVAIPSLLLHAFLSRKSKSIIDDMERTAVAFMNHVHSPLPVDSHSVGVA